MHIPKEDIKLMLFWQCMCWQHSLHFGSIINLRAGRCALKSSSPSLWMDSFFCYCGVVSSRYRLLKIVLQDINHKSRLIWSSEGKELRWLFKGIKLNLCGWNEKLRHVLFHFCFVVVYEVSDALFFKYARKLAEWCFKRLKIYFFKRVVL